MVRPAGRSAAALDRDLISSDFGDQATRLAADDFDSDGLTDVASVTFERERGADLLRGTARRILVRCWSWAGDYTGSNAIKRAISIATAGSDLITTTYGNDSRHRRISWWDNEP